MWPRILELERRIEELAARLARLEGRQTQLGQQIGVTVYGGGGSGGGSGWIYWARTPGSVSAATGTWPAITPSTFTANVYVDAGGLSLQATSATVRWFYKDTEAVNKLVPCVSNGDGTYTALASSCTAV